jgi:hypothetical protein
MRQQNPKRKCGRERVLSALSDPAGAWVAAFLLAQVGGLQFQTRIWELRHIFGYHIENREERRQDGTVLSFYRLVPKQPTTLFDIAPPDRSYCE